MFNKTSVNLVQLVGRMGDDAKMTKIVNESVTNLIVATSEYFKDEKNEVQTVTEWHKVTTWGKLAELAGKLKKGDLVAIRGKNRSKIMKENDNGKGERLDKFVKAEEVTILSRYNKSVESKVEHGEDPFLL